MSIVCLSLMLTKKTKLKFILVGNEAVKALIHTHPYSKIHASTGSHDD